MQFIWLKLALNFTAPLCRIYCKAKSTSYMALDKRFTMHMNIEPILFNSVAFIYGRLLIVYSTSILCFTHSSVAMSIQQTVMLTQHSHRPTSSVCTSSASSTQLPSAEETVLGTIYSGIGRCLIRRAVAVSSFTIFNVPTLLPVHVCRIVYKDIVVSSYDVVVPVMRGHACKLTPNRRCIRTKKYTLFIFGNSLRPQTFIQYSNLQYIFSWSCTLAHQRCTMYTGCKVTNLLWVDSLINTMDKIVWVMAGGLS